MAKLKKAAWTTAQGEKIPYEKLEKKHLQNILKDGYRNPHLIAEATRRKMKIPRRPIDDLSFFDLMMLIESFASNALEGNEVGEKFMELYEKPDKSDFYFHLNRWLVKNPLPKKK